MVIHMYQRHGILLLALLLLMGFGCASDPAPNPSALRSISHGSHVPYSDERWERILRKQDDKLRFVVWGNHPGALHRVMGILLAGGNTVVERVRLQQIFDEQRIRLTHTPDDDANILKVGKLAGADRVIFIEVSDREQSALFGTVHHVSAAVRCVAVESGEVRWSGHSTLSRPITDPEAALPALAEGAMGRAICPLERGYEWVELTADGPGAGCKKKGMGD